MNKILKNFNEKGYIVKNIFDIKELLPLVKDFEQLLIMQANKMRLKVHDDLIKNILEIQKHFPAALNESYFMLRNTSSGHALASNLNLKLLANNLIGFDQETPLIISGPSFFINIPSNNTRKYTFHSEQNWYPKRRNFINVWCPILKNRVNDDSIAILPESHKKNWYYFSEYAGYDGKLNELSNVQYEIPSNFLSKYNQIIPKVKVGEGLVFHGNMLHSSLDCNQVQLAIAFRIFNYSKDLTLSSNWADIPYNRKSIGYPDINVKD